MLEQVGQCLPPGWTRTRATIVDRLYSIVAPVNTADSRVRRYTLVYADYETIARTFDPAQAFTNLASDISLWTAILAPRRVFVHAGVVAWRGRALVLPGRTLAGKSTLVAALVRAGATYYSDEWAVFDDQGRVHPFARPLSLRGTGDEPERSVPVEALGGRAGRSALPVGLVVMTRFNAEAQWRPRQLSNGAGALAVLGHAVQTHRDPARVLGALGRVVANAPVLESERGHADQLAPALLEQLEETARRRMPSATKNTKHRRRDGRSA